MSVHAEALKNIPNPIIDITNYWQHYGLRHDPFATLVEEEYYTLTRWEEHLDLLQYLCHYNNVLISITGVNGSGKTTLIHQFISQVGNAMNICQVTADSTLTTDQLLEITSTAFNLDYNPEITEEDQLDQHLAMIQTSDKICLIIIDDAHLLSSEIFRSLFYLISQQTDTQKRLHVILLGEPQLQLSLSRLAQNEGHSELLHPIILEPLSLEETESYLQHRLQNAGLNGEFPLSSLEVARIYKLSEGVPGRINRISRRTLLNALARQHVDSASHFLSMNKAKIYGGALLLFLAGITVGILNWMIPDKSYTAKKINRPHAIEKMQLSQTELISTAPAKPVSNPNPSQISKTPTDKTLVVTHDNTFVKNMIPLFTPTSVQHEIPFEKMPVQPKEVALALPQQKTVQPQVTLPQPKPSVSAPAPAHQVTLASPHHEVVKTPAPVQANIKTTVTPKPVALAAPLKINKPHHALVIKKSKPVHIPTETGTEYTVQLLGLSNEQSVKDLIHKLHLTQINYHRTLLHGKDFYLLTYGHFKTEKEAQLAIQHLPKLLKAQHPFPKKIETVQECQDSSCSIIIPMTR